MRLNITGSTIAAVFATTIIPKFQENRVGIPSGSSHGTHSLIANGLLSQAASLQARLCLPAGGELEGMPRWTSAEHHLSILPSETRRWDSFDEDYLTMHDKRSNPSRFDG
ncbi:hypothetical protein EW146_g5595 [Bondarzewia mesenterica]|uniref:Uncharacterized protein n=1 Tax=Bondarzewia mesenterica TaxID=1095465 RepID=A0A4S4LR02_9AGAM|nr:hypothetical protein EW146_g5595 [Bondarzewia mesenterica]